MTYNVHKRNYLFLSAIFCIPFLLYWAMYFLQYYLPPINWLLYEATDLGYWFHGEPVMVPLFYGVAVLIITAIVYLIAYRKEIPLWTKIALALSSAVMALFSLLENIPERFYGTDLKIFAYITSYIIAAVPLATIIGLIIAMVKYPKKPAKSE